MKHIQARLPPKRHNPPCEDDNGSFWLSDRKAAPAIFQVWNPNNPAHGDWFPCPEEGDVPFVDGKLLTFATPLEALEWMLANYSRKR